MEASVIIVTSDGNNHGTMTTMTMTISTGYEKGQMDDWTRDGGVSAWLRIDGRRSRVKRGGQGQDRTEPAIAFRTRRRKWRRRDNQSRKITRRENGSFLDSVVLQLSRCGLLNRCRLRPLTPVLMAELIRMSGGAYLMGPFMSLVEARALAERGEKAEAEAARATMVAAIFILK